MDKYLIFLPVCILSKGFTRTAIYDTQREVIEFVPNDVYNFYTECNKKSIGYIKKKYSGEDLETVLEYIDFLVDNEYAILGSKKDAECIATLNTEWKNIGKITNCVCEYSYLIQKSFKKITTILDDIMGYSAIQIVSFDKVIPMTNLQKLLNILSSTKNIFHIEIATPYNEDYNLQKVQSLLTNFLIVNRIIIHSSPFEYLNNSNSTVTIYTHQGIKECGFIGKDYFSLNMQHITESLKYNTCLNKKIFIDKRGNIKNCPFANISYGNILKDKDINKILSSKEFRKLWSINKDSIEACKDCEFRYICSDCRIFIENPDNIYSKPMHCTYNPYTGKWTDES